MSVAAQALFFSRRDSFRREGLRVGRQSSQGNQPGEAALVATILFISLSAAQNNLEADWAEAGGGHSSPMPDLSCDSIIGHGRRRKQAHDEDHDWIQIRRGLCSQCGKTFTFLPPFSPPYCHYSSDRPQPGTAALLCGRLWLGSVGADRLRTPTAWPMPLPSADGFAVWIPLGHRSRSCAALCVSVSEWLGAGQIISCTDSLPLSWQTYFRFSTGSGRCGSEKLRRPPSLPGNTAASSPTLDCGGKTAPWVRIWSG